MLYPEVGERTVALLERLGCEVAFPAGQTCCGQPANNSGYPADARRVAERFLDPFGSTDGPIVAPFGSCVHMVRHAYPRLFADDPERAALAAAVGERTFHLPTIVVRELGRAAAGGHSPGAGETPGAYPHECHTLPR